MNACSCSNPECLVFGCSIERQRVRDAMTPEPIRWPAIKPFRAQPGRVPIGVTTPSAPLTAEDVRRIIREELARLTPPTELPGDAK